MFTCSISDSFIENLKEQCIDCEDGPSIEQQNMTKPIISQYSDPAAKGSKVFSTKLFNHPHYIPHTKIVSYSTPKRP